MRSTFYGFEIAKSGLFASQRNLDVTGHNISNVNTKGYTRQVLNVQAVPAPNYMGTVAYSDKAASGQGVRMMYVDQIRDPFLDIQYREENTQAKNWEVQEYEFSMIEQLFNFEITEDDSGISNVFADFYAALHSFAENPSDLEIRQSILGSAKNLIATMNQNADKIKDQYNDINEAVKSSVLQINTITKAIAELNNQIFAYEMSGGKANDLRDQRNLLLDELSGYIPIDYKETPQGYLIVEYQGEKIVNHSQQKDLAVAATKAHAFLEGEMVYEVYWADQIDQATGTPMTDPDTGAAYTPIAENEGALGAYFKMRDGDSEKNIGLPYVMNLLDNLCKRIAVDFNSVHVKGWSLPKADGTASQQGNKLFYDGIASLTIDGDGNITGYTLEDGTTGTGNPYEDANLFSGITALNFAIDPNIDEYGLAASSEQIVTGADNEQRQNNLIALELVEMLNKTNSAGNPDNFDSIYKDILVAVGLEMSHIIRMNNNQATVLANIEANRESVSGVSIDEEVTNVIKYGHSYNAASRMITAIDEQLDTIINKMGMVGR